MATRIPMIIGGRMKTCLALVALVAACTLAGCAGPKVTKAPVFFPLPPDEPRVQYLTGINDSTDVNEKKKQTSFSLLVTGRETEVIRKLAKSYGVRAANGKIYVSESGAGGVVIIDPVKGTFDSPTGLADPRGRLQTPVNVVLD